MYVWLVCFVVLFGLAELYPWVQGMVLPFPVILLAGVGLAIASNLDKLSRDKLSRLSGRSTSPSPQVLSTPAPTPTPPTTATVTDSALPSPPPKRTPAIATPPSDSISFTIRKL